MVYSGAWGKLINEKNQKQKISWHCPFNPLVPNSLFFDQIRWKLERALLEV